MAEDRVWLAHEGHEGYFHCPAEAVDAWAEMGWFAADSPPEEHNPVIAEHLAAQQAAAAEREAQQKEAAVQVRAEKKAAKAAESTTDTPEGN